MLTCAKGTGVLQDISDISCELVMNRQGAGLNLRPGHTLFRIVICVRRYHYFIVQWQSFGTFLLSGKVKRKDNKQLLVGYHTQLGMELNWTIPFFVARNAPEGLSA